MPMVSIRQRQTEVPRLAVPIILGRGERWCVRCGESTVDGGPCPRCAGSDFVDPRRLLRPGEYVVI